MIAYVKGAKGVCACGDFNAVRSVDERRSVRGSGSVHDNPSFNHFIDENVLIDLPLCGRRYTWFKGDGLSMSRIDRFLLSEEWCIQWPNCFQVALLRVLSDHCSLQLSVDEDNWELRPSRMLKCWQDMSRYTQFVCYKWKSFQLDGWADYVAKEKLKLIKATLKEWHYLHAKNIPARLDSLKICLSKYDEKGEDAGLSPEEIADMRSVTHEIFSVSRVNTSISWQQSRLSPLW